MLYVQFSIAYSDDEDLLFLIRLLKYAMISSIITYSDKVIAMSDLALSVCNKICIGLRRPLIYI